MSTIPLCGGSDPHGGCDPGAFGNCNLDGLGESGGDAFTYAAAHADRKRDADGAAKRHADAHREPVGDMHTDGYRKRPRR